MSKDQSIREIAYAIWDSEGRPDGQDEEHWQRAELLVEEQEEVPVELEKIVTEKKPAA